MKNLRRVINPLLAFIAIQLTWVLIVIFWVNWFLGSHRKLRQLAQRYSPELVARELDWLILIEGLLLLGVILAGVYVIFIYWQRQLALNRAQKQLLSQVTHELKSPVASLQLHLETIALQHPEPEELQRFIQTMQADTQELNQLIDKLLQAGKQEQRWPPLSRQALDISHWLREELSQRHADLWQQGRLYLDAPGPLWVRMDPKAMAMVLRNLLENAQLYSPADTPVEVVLTVDDKRQHCLLRVKDQGRGLSRRERKRIFRMFYRVRLHGDPVKGTGLGLFIVRAIVKQHQGRVWVSSPGPGQGTTVHVQLPLIPDPQEAFHDS